MGAILAAIAAVLLFGREAPPFADDPSTVLEIAHGADVVSMARGDIARASAMAGPDGTLSFTLMPWAGEAVLRLTTDAVGQTIEISVCGSLVSKPVVRDPIGQWGLLSMGDAAAAMEAAEILRGARACPEP